MSQEKSIEIVCTCYGEFLSYISFCFVVVFYLMKCMGIWLGTKVAYEMSSAVFSVDELRLYFLLNLT